MKIEDIRPGDKINTDANWVDGWVLSRFKKSSGEVTFECWPPLRRRHPARCQPVPRLPQTVKP